MFGIPFFVFILLEFLYWYYARTPKLYYAVFGLAMSTVLIGTSVLAGRRTFGELSMVLLTPMLFVISQFIFVVFLQGNILKHGIALTNIFLGVFLENVYLRYYKPEKYAAYSMGNILGFLNIVIFYLFTASVFGYILYLEFPIWAGTALIVFVTSLASFQVHTLQGISLQQSWPYTVIITLLVAEFFWTINFLPSSIYVNAFILTIMYYAMMGISKNHLLGILHRGIIARYLMISVISLAFVLISAKWA